MLLHLMGPQTYGWAQVQNIKRDPFEQAVGEDQKSVMSIGGALAAPSTAYLYNWNMLPVGQQLWLQELSTYIDFPPLQDPASYNLTQVLEQIKKIGDEGPGPIITKIGRIESADGRPEEAIPLRAVSAPAR